MRGMPTAAGGRHLPGGPRTQRRGVRAAAARRRLRDHRQDEPVRVRDGWNVAERALRRRAQPAQRAARCRRIVERERRRGRGRALRRRAGDGHARLDPHPGGLLRRRRLQAAARRDPAPRRVPELALARLGRRARARRPHRGAHRRPDARSPPVRATRRAPRASPCPGPGSKAYPPTCAAPSCASRSDLDDIALPPLEAYGPAAFGVLAVRVVRVAPPLAARSARALRRVRSAISSRRARARRGRRMTRHGARWLRLRSATRRALATVDAIVLPTVPFTPPLRARYPLALRRTLSAWTRPFNVSDSAVFSIPIPGTRLPIGTTDRRERRRRPRSRSPSGSNAR